ncbi:uncharacterized protein LOC132610221 [Lycium barbarum]|uniref:uncharacterized protein LOC132610221 n=1 Tax=Lycium barbarum TaxID=112863 RepID=UPI00293F100E|nr:uncharacterized protein LOC132610221 [Lycium barbarum]
MVTSLTSQGQTCLKNVINLSWDCIIIFKTYNLLQNTQKPTHIIQKLLSTHPTTPTTPFYFKKKKKAIPQAAKQKKPATTPTIAAAARSSSKSLLFLIVAATHFSLSPLLLLLYSFSDKMTPVKRKGEKPTEGESSKRAKVQTPLDKLVTAICQLTNLEERVSETGASEREETHETFVGHEEESDKNEQSKEQHEDKEDEGDDEVDKDEETREERDEEEGDEGDEGGEEDAETEKDPNRPSIDEVVKSFSIEKYSVTMPLNGNNDLSGDFVVRSSMGKSFDTFRGILRQQGLENFFRASFFELYLYFA